MESYSVGRTGARIKAVRTKLGLTLREVSERSGVPLSTISKVENGQKTSVDTLVKIARGLGVLFDVLLHDSVPDEPVVGRRAIETSQSALRYETELYDYQTHGAALTHKAMLPLVITVKTRAVPARDDWSTHAGEEFIYVCHGAIELHSEYYAPKRLEAGESAYFDSKMRHAYVSVSDDDAVIVSVCTEGVFTYMGGDPWDAVRTSPLSEEVSRRNE